MPSQLNLFCWLLCCGSWNFFCEHPTTKILAYCLKDTTVASCPRIRQFSISWVAVMVPETLLLDLPQPCPCLDPGEDASPYTYYVILTESRLLLRPDCTLVSPHQKSSRRVRLQKTRRNFSNAFWTHVVAPFPSFVAQNNGRHLDLPRALVQLENIVHAFPPFTVGVMLPRQIL